MADLGDRELAQAANLMRHVCDDGSKQKMSLEKLAGMVHFLCEIPWFKRALDKQENEDLKKGIGASGYIVKMLPPGPPPPAPKIGAVDYLRNIPGEELILGEKAHINVGHVLRMIKNELSRQHREWMAGRLSSKTPIPSTPIADEGIGELEYSIDVSAWKTVNNQSFNKVQNILINEQIHADELLKLFAVLTCLETGREDPLPWWPAFLRTAARNIGFE